MADDLSDLVWVDTPDDAPPIERHDEILKVERTGRCSCGRRFGHEPTLGPE